MNPPVSQPNSEPVNRNKLPETEANVTKRTLQLREAQRVHREKKLRHLKDMEDTIAQLREENKEVQSLRETVKALQFELSLLKGSLTCVVCSVPLTSTVQARQVDAKLDQAKVCNGVMDTPSSGSESVVTGVSCSPATVSPESDRFDYQMTELDTFLSTVVPKMITSEELYGPLEVDAGRLLIRTIPSLKGSSDPDRMFDLIVVRLFFIGYGRS
ncbi:hypothetical protein BCR33DRAFT_376177 [Rhizoclosmatium globosum]|uniref:BZIP domain-containing protein n=1 Tax=Rhizoclosmatium globosum TaxID=329046 RepID=A0A1Y2BYU9_9FUNG|nr:hypothetical protein BCR33DRAFT_376177 [Rhizoclosmatium globosum]|eukprot:ORY39817.1 hypothetical protein BCR33DRAFT_376177 [Rhizoclosmatium globosum]